MLRLAISALERRVLPGRDAAIALVCPLRAGLRYGRDQQQLLPIAFDELRPGKPVMDLYIINNNF